MITYSELMQTISVIIAIAGFILNAVKAIPHKDSAADAPSIFSSLTVIKRVLCRMTEKEQADVVLSCKAVFVRCCLKIYHDIKKK